MQICKCGHSLEDHRRNVSGTVFGSCRSCLSGSCRSCHCILYECMMCGHGAEYHYIHSVAFYGRCIKCDGDKRCIYDSVIIERRIK